MEGTVECDFTLPARDIVYCVEFSPFEWSSSLLAIGTRSNVTILSVYFEEEKHSVDGFEYEEIGCFQHNHRVHAVAFSPNTSLQLLNKCLKFATSSGSKQLQVYTSYMKDDATIEVLEGHTDYINSIAFDPESDELASVSDDLTCRVWSQVSRNGQKSKEWKCKVVMTLTSPGMSVHWHRDDPGKLLVAEKKGVIRFYNVRNGHPVLSLECNNIPLMSADWCPQNSLQVLCAAGPECFFWDSSVSSRPSARCTVHTEGVLAVQFSHCNQLLYGTRGRPGGQIRVANINTKQVLLSENLQIGSGLSWHSHFPFVVAGGYRRVYIWKIIT